MSIQSRFEYKGDMITIHDMVAMSGVCYQTIYNRIRAGKTVEEAMQPLQREYHGHPKYYWRGHEYSMKELSEASGVSRRQILRRMHAHPESSLDEILSPTFVIQKTAKYSLGGMPITLIDFCERFDLRYKSAASYMKRHKGTTLDELLADEQTMTMLKKFEPPRDDLYRWKGSTRTVEQIAMMEDLDPVRLQSYMDNTKSVYEAVYRTKHEFDGRACVSEKDFLEAAYRICQSIIFGKPERCGFGKIDGGGGYSFGEGICRYTVTLENRLAHLTMVYSRSGKKGSLSRWFGKLRGTLREVNADGTV